MDKNALLKGLRQLSEPNQGLVYLGGGGSLTPRLRADGKHACGPSQ